MVNEIGPVDLDDTIGDIHGLIVDKEIEIMHELVSFALTHAIKLVELTSIFSELDCLLSLAEAAKRLNYVRPTLTEENKLDIREGRYASNFFMHVSILSLFSMARHPLQELVVDTFIPNDTLIGQVKPAKPQVIFLTGPNYSGKSVYLKHIALITFLAHIGSFVPAQEATIGLTDKIFTRIQSQESVSKLQSTFMIDLQQVSFALRNATRNSLVLIDEFGKGTAIAGKKDFSSFL